MSAPEVVSHEPALAGSTDRETEDYAYDAFISYKHDAADRRWAKWLQRALEAYRVPRRVAREKHIPKRLKRVFRDEEELSASADLSKSIDAALVRSKFLVVVCSPRTPPSRWINAEVERFRALGRDDRILSLLIEGEPSESFPAALSVIRGASTIHLTGDELNRLEPLAADVRPSTTDSQRSMRRAATLRLVATILGCEFDELRRREHERRFRRVTAVAFGSTTLAIGAVALSLYSIEQRRTAVEQRLIAVEQRDLAQAQLGRAFYERAQALTGERRHAAAAITAGRAVGLLGDAARASATFSPLLDPNSTVGAEARSLVQAYPLMLWQAAVRNTGSAWVTAVRYSRDGTVLLSGDTGGTVRLWNTASGALTGEIEAHKRGVTDLEVSGDRRVFASAGGDGVVRLWDLSRTTPIHQWVPAGGNVTDLVFSPDGKRLASAGRGRVIEIRDVPTGKITETLEGSEKGTSSIAFDNTGAHVAAGSSDGTVRLWDTASKKSTILHNQQPIYSLAFDSKGQLLVASGDGAISIWNVTNGQQVARLVHPVPTQVRPARGPQGYPLAPSTDEQVLATAAPDGSILIWDVSARRVRYTLAGHSSTVLSLSLAPGGASLASGGFDGNVNVWNLQRRTLEQRAEGHAGRVSAVSFHPKGRWIASAGLDDSVRLWDADKGEQIAVLPTRSGWVASLAVSPDGKRLAVGCSLGLEVWDVDARSVITATPAALVTSVQFSSDGRKLGFGSFLGQVEVWDLTTAATVTLEAGKTPVHGLVFDRSGARLITASEDGRVILWDLSTQQAIWRRGGAVVYDAALDPSGTTLATATAGGEVQLRQMSDGQMLTTLRGALGLVDVVDYSDDGRLLASAGADGRIRLWNAISHELITVIDGHAGPVKGISFAPSRPRLASAGNDHTVRLWDLEAAVGSAELKGHLGRVTSAAFSPDGATLASGGRDNTVRLWDVASAMPRRVLRHGESVEALTFSPDGLMLAAAGTFNLRGPTVLLWSVATGTVLKPLEGLEFGYSVTHLSFDRAGRRLVAGTNDGVIAVWDVGTGKLEASLRSHGGSVNGMQFAPDGRTLVTAGRDGTMHLWDVSNWRDSCTLRDPDGSIEDLSFHPTGDLLATGDNNGSIKIWDVRSGSIQRTLNGHDKQVTKVLFSPDGTMLLSGSLDRTVKVWDAASGRSVSTYRGHTDLISSLGITPDGRAIASASYDLTVRLWPVRRTQTIPAGLLPQIRFRGLELEFLPPPPNLYGTSGIRLSVDR